MNGLAAIFSLGFSGIADAKKIMILLIIPHGASLPPTAAVGQAGRLRAIEADKF
jgi:hypothetical protein